MFLRTMGVPQYDAFMMFRQTADLMESVLAQRCRPYGLTLPAMEVMYMIAYRPKPLSSYQLARILGRKHHSVFDHCNRLSRKGWVVKDKVDGRPSLSITEVGQKLLDEVSEVVFADPLLRTLSDEDLAQLIRLLVPVRRTCLEELRLRDLGKISMPSVGSAGESGDSTEADSDE